MKMNTKMTTRLTMICALFVASGLARAQEASDGKTFDTTVSIGATLTEGNSDTMAVHGSVIATGEKEGLGSIRAGVEGNYGETTVRETYTDGAGNTRDRERDETNIENLRGYVNLRKTLSEMTFVYADSSALYDDIAAVDYRIMAGPGLGMYLLKNERSALSFEAGASYLWEEVDEVSDDYAILRLSERFEHKLSETAHFWQSLEYLPEFSDFDNYLMIGEVGIDAAINAHMSLRLVLQDTYDSTPGAGLKHNDLTLIAAVGIRL